MCATIRARAGRVLLLTLTIAGIAVVAATVGALAADRFGDVAAGHAHADGIGWVADAQVTLGCGDGSDYCPGDAVTRAQMATFMHRLAGHASGIAPSVDAATLQGLTPAELGGDTSQIEARLDALEGRVDELEADNGALQATVAVLEGHVADLQVLLAGVSRVQVDGNDTLRFSNMNVQVVNGTGDTGGEPNGLGNLIIGYNTQRPAALDPAERTGSHYLVVGDEHDWTAFGGLLAGLRNTASGDWASVSGGSGNIASGDEATVSGGGGNTASGFRASVTGGSSNTASSSRASVTGGQGNTASDSWASVTGGVGNTASRFWASVTGGRDNTASGSRASVSGGEGNTASGATAASVSGGAFNTASGDWASVSGGRGNFASGDEATAAGGASNTASGLGTSVSGGTLNTASGFRASVLGGSGNTVGTTHGCHPAC